MSVGHVSLELPEGKEASMPALGTSLVVRDVNDKNLFSKELWWWNPRPLTGNPLFTRVDVPAYKDLIAESPVFMMMTGIKIMKSKQLVSREDVVQFVMCAYDEPRSMATKCVRKMRWGYRITDPLIVKSYPLLVLGSTLIAVHPETGIYMPLSSSPIDMIGPLSFSTLNSVDDFNAMVLDRGILEAQSIHNFINECTGKHAALRKSHVHC